MKTATVHIKHEATKLVGYIDGARQFFLSEALIAKNTRRKDALLKQLSYLDQLKQIANGKSISEIAEELNESESHLKQSLRAMLQRLELYRKLKMKKKAG